MTLSRSAFSGERKEVNISRLALYKQFESKQKGMKCEPSRWAHKYSYGSCVSFQEETKTR